MNFIEPILNTIYGVNNQLNTVWIKSSTDAFLHNQFVGCSSFCSWPGNCFSNVGFMLTAWLIPEIIVWVLLNFKKFFNLWKSICYGPYHIRDINPQSKIFSINNPDLNAYAVWSCLAQKYPKKHKPGVAPFKTNWFWSSLECVASRLLLGRR